MSERPIVVFSDGATKGNPGPGGWGAVVVTPDGQVVELGGGTLYTTNNKMELTGAIRALEHVRGTTGAVAMYTDSTYVIKGIREWIWSWKRRGWRTAEGNDVQNRDLWEQLHDLVVEHGRATIAWHYVRGHVGIAGNERVDEIADAFARQKDTKLYRGDLAGYARPILDVPDDTSVPERPKGSPRKTNPAAFSYLSVVDGTPMRHATWADCERRVSGRSGARFKKALSPGDEAEILKSWQIDPGKL